MKKLKELVDMGVLTQEEFSAKRERNNWALTKSRKAE
ncbi:SHOCT domain-containing protein [Fictibacillus arsenicus]|nr:SHOCT domain-containing protein [Fictibacillus arsenicus]